MKIYFACSITGGGDNSNYLMLLKAIQAAGADVISEVFVHDALQLGGSPLPPDEIYQRDVNMIHECDAVIAELSNPSLGVGYELAYAEKIGRPVLGLYNTGAEKRLSAMIAGNPYFDVHSYSTEQPPAEAIRVYLQEVLPAIQKRKLEQGDSSVIYLSNSEFAELEKILDDDTPNPKLLSPCSSKLPHGTRSHLINCDGC